MEGKVGSGLGFGFGCNAHSGSRRTPSLDYGLLRVQDINDSCSAPSQTQTPNPNPAFTRTARTAARARAGFRATSFEASSFTR